MLYLQLVMSVLSMVLVPPSAMAQDECKSAPIFYCEIKDLGKIVHLCETGGQIEYTFGKKGLEPELALSIDRSAAHVTPWNGMGHDYWSSIEIPNGQWAYRLAVSYKRGAEDAPTLGSVTVLKNGNDIKTFQCIGATVKERIETLVN